MSSVRARLLFWLLAAWGLAGVVAAFLTYRTAVSEADQVFDRHLKQIALSLRDQPFEDQDILGTLEEESDYDFVIEVWDRRRTKLYSSHSEDRVPQVSTPGFSFVMHGGETWRVFLLALDGTNIQIAQPMAVRQARAARLAMRTITPFLALVPIMGLLIWFTVRRGLAPLHGFARAIGERDHNSLSPMTVANLPEELLPVERELNQLLARLRVAIDAQRTFTANAAHELRTPLTAVQLQAQLAQRAEDPAARAEALDQLRAGLKRSIQLVQQLLALARAENGIAPAQKQSLDLGDAAREVVVSFADQAAAKQIDLGFLRGAPAPVQTDRSALAMLVGNLVGNAIQYTPAGGKVDVAVLDRPEGPALEVRDNGPGIPTAERTRVFDRFHRGESAVASGSLGSGLGLSIVKSIADQHGASVSLHDGETGKGLTVRVQFRTAKA